MGIHVARPDFWSGQEDDQLRFYRRKGRETVLGNVCGSSANCLRVVMARDGSAVLYPRNGDILFLLQTKEMGTDVKIFAVTSRTAGDAFLLMVVDEEGERTRMMWGGENFLGPVETDRFEALRKAAIGRRPIP